MVVDDEPDNRSAVKAILDKNGYDVVTAVNGDDCLKKLENEKVDLILTDIMMPGTPVIEVIKKFPNTKVIYMSVVRISGAEREELLKSKNIVGFIQKPFNDKTVIEEVKNALRR